MRADYSRSLLFVDAFPDPFATDQANATIGGPLGRRVSASGQVRYWTGIATVTTDSDDQRVDGWQITTRVDVGVTRRMRAYTQYHYTANRFSEGALASLPPGVLPRSNWGGVIAGLELWLPFVH
jgi:hypothetical protein